MPTWNHWWPYEDAEIDEATFLANVEAADRTGLDVAVLDAGWFGRAEASSDWVEERGDWDRVNTARFPHGLAWLAEQTRQGGIDFGLWIEAEAVGGGQRSPSSTRRSWRRTPDRRSAGGAWDLPPAGPTCADHVARLIGETGARWIKWDFNLDPGGRLSAR